MPRHRTDLFFAYSSRIALVLSQAMSKMRGAALSICLEELALHGFYVLSLKIPHRTRFAIGYRIEYIFIAIPRSLQ